MTKIYDTEKFLLNLDIHIDSMETQISIVDSMGDFNLNINICRQAPDSRQPKIPACSCLDERTIRSKLRCIVQWKQMYI